MDINNAYVRDAILYFTIQQYFNCNDKKTSQFIAQLDHFNYRSGLIHNILTYPCNYTYQRRISIIPI